MEEDKIKELERKLQNATIFHALTIKRDEVQIEDRYIRNVSFSSSEPIQHWFGYLILDHNPGSIRLQRWQTSPAFLDNHDPNAQRGVLINGDVKNNKNLVADIFFSQNENALELKRDIEDGIRVHTSLGFLIHGKIEFEMDQGGNKVTIGEEDVYRCKDWEPLEGSSVSIPADISVGIGRALFEERNSENLKQEIEKLKNEFKQINKPLEVKMEQPKEKTSEEILQEERSRVAEITTLAKRHNLDPSEAIKNGTSIEAFRGIVLDKIGDKTPLEKDPSDLGLSRKEKEEYSLFRMIRSQIPGDPLSDQKTFEKELSDVIASKLGRSPKGMFVPYDALTKVASFKRDITAGGSHTGDDWVSKEWRGGEFIDLLRNKMALYGAGARIWAGLTGTVYVPKLSVGSVFGWRATENAATSESTPTTAQLVLTPKSGGTYVDISKASLLQGNPDVEATLTNDLIQSCALGLDKAGLHGTGSSGQPTGIEYTSGIGGFNGASITWADVIEAQTDVETANADVATMSYITTPSIRGLLKTRPKEAALSHGYLCDMNNTMAGYPVFATNQVTDGYMFFGDYSQVIFGLWQGIDVLVDPYTLGKEGLVRILGDLYADVAIRHAGAFSMASSVS